MNCSHLGTVSGCLCMLRHALLETSPMNENTTHQRTALLAGATGAVGRQLLSQLLADKRYSQIHVLTRRPIAATEARLQVHEIDFEKLDQHAALFDVDDVFCCLGTTIKQARSKAAFRRVDHDYVVSMAQLASEAGARSFLMISAVGADPRSLFFYSRVKGETEQDVAACGPDSIHILRPSLLMGERSEHRTGEEFSKRIMPVFSPLMGGALSKYRPVHVSAVASKLLTLAAQTQPGVHIHYCT